ncbi:hypothetical protein [Aliarcobacter cibarius]|uniref:Uncharacterized protein n=2 Tax=Aliarcobacter cibarius TaxID=255507 RepID=A0ABY2V467_9BACT|nr:hypothetical protein [Aliarcobacter cibarius]TLS96606.1 hypothetical protein FE247_09615 [Aliarcobacter cibarius]TLS97027.1 hypothetical protein FE245_09825 [Aliarcobacter cibarius]
MFSLDNVVLPEIFSNRLSFLENYKLIFGDVINTIGRGNDILNFIIISFILILFFKNSMEKMIYFYPSRKTIFLTVFCLIYGLLSLNKVSEFLYFNF